MQTKVGGKLYMTECVVKLLPRWMKGREMKIIYDDSCPPCSLLAQMMARISLEGVEYIPFSLAGILAGIEDERDELVVVWDERIYRGIEAWDVVVSAYPIFRTLDRWASKLGFSQGLPRILHRTGHRLRARCRKC